MTSTAPFTIAYGGYRHRSQVAALVLSCLCPAGEDAGAYLDNFRDRARRAVRTVLMLDGDRVVGHVIAEKPGGHIGRQWTKFVGSSAVEIGALAVDPEYRGRGFGRRLFDEAISFAVANHYQPVCVTAVDNEGGQHMLADLKALPRQPFWIGEHHYQPFVLPAVPAVGQS